MKNKCKDTGHSARNYKKGISVYTKNDRSRMIFIQKLCKRRRSSGLMVSVLASGSRSLGRRALGRGPCVVLLNWARLLTVTAPLATQEYKWVPAILRWTHTPSGERRNTSRRFMLQKSEKNVGLMGDLSRIYADFTTLLCNVGCLVILRELKA